MKNYSVKNKNYCVNNEKYCVNKLIYCVNNFGFDIQTLGCAQLASPQGSLNFVNPYPDLCNLQGNAQETELFYYHPDHLGSTGMVTDNSSIISQGFLYAPFGEIISEYTPGWETDRIPKYAFNAKELDEENNMYYYSARYYAPPTFISRDPMFEKYPSISPYTYCANNPVMFVDPTGEEGEDSESWIKRKDGSYVFDSRVITQKDAEKYYGKGAEAIADGYYIQTTKGEVTFLDNGVYMLNDEKHQVKDQAKGIAKVVAEIRNFDASLEGHNDGDNSGDPWLQKNAAPILEGVVIFHPIVGFANGVYTAAAGEDIYGNEASTAGRIISGVGVVAGGVGKVASGVASTVAKGIDWAIDVWTVIQTTRDGYNKKNKK